MEGGLTKAGLRSYVTAVGDNDQVNDGGLTRRKFYDVVN